MQSPFNALIIILTVPGSHPSNTTGTTLNSTHIYLMWEPPEDPNGDIREYRVNVTEEETGRMFQFSTNTTSITIGSLHPYYTYNCTVVAVTIGPGPFSTVITLRTAEDGRFHHCKQRIASHMQILHNLLRHKAYS